MGKQMSKDISCCMCTMCEYNLIINKFRCSFLCIALLFFFFVFFIIMIHNTVIIIIITRPFSVAVATAATVAVNVVVGLVISDPFM